MMQQPSPPTEADQIDLDALIAPVADVERAMAAFIAERPMAENLRDAIEYTLLGGGKRMRPLLVVLSCEAVGGDREAALAPAGALELIHAFSLVHDDLPAMDDDDLRRGRPTLHRHTNEAMAILAGDMMMGLAFEWIATRVTPAQAAARLTSELATATGDMIVGQVHDTLPQLDASLSPLERLRLIHRHKTGALIRAACRMGAIAGDADDQTLHALTRYGETIGLMFQVVDDLLDVTQSTEHLGKASHKDEAAGKATYPALLGLEETREHVRQLHVEAHQLLEPLGAEGRPLRRLSDYLAVRTR